LEVFSCSIFPPSCIGVAKARCFLLRKFCWGRDGPPVLLPRPLAIKRARNRTGSPVCCAIERDEHVGVDVLNLNTLWHQADVDLAASVDIAALAIGV
jgi:hypothetical protein